MPPAVELAIDDQRKSIETAISLLYCLHSALRREVDDVGTLESEALENASKSADLTNISAMLLVRLDSIHAALDPLELEQVKVDPETLRISEPAREMFESCLRTVQCHAVPVREPPRRRKRRLLNIADRAT